MSNKHKIDSILREMAEKGEVMNEQRYKEVIDLVMNINDSKSTVFNDIFDALVEEKIQLRPNEFIPIQFDGMQGYYKISKVNFY